MSDPFLGEVRLFAFGFVPKDWFPCDGRLLPTANYTALFAVLLNRFGGDGVHNFALPDLRGRAAAGVGKMPGGTVVNLGFPLGLPAMTLDRTTLAKHSHTLRKKVTNARPAVSKTSAPSAVSDLGGLGDALGTVNYKSGIAGNPVPDTVLDPNTIAMAGNPMPAGHENRQPYLAMTYAIAHIGIVPIHT